MKEYLKLIDKNTKGNRYDITPLFANAKQFADLVEDLAKPFKNSKIEFVVCIDALGFILGSFIAKYLNVGVIPIRKGGKLPVDTHGVNFVDYSKESKRLEIRKDVLPKNSKVLIVDEWVETGSQVKAAIELVEMLKANVVGITSINMDQNNNTDLIRDNYRVHTVWED